MANLFLLRVSLLSVRFIYHILPILSWILKVAGWLLIAAVTLLLLIVIF